MSYDTVLLEQPHAGTWLLTVNRPKSLNALAPILVPNTQQALTCWWCPIAS